MTSDVLNVSKDNDDRRLMFLQFKTFTSLEFRLSAVVAGKSLASNTVERLLWLETFEFSRMLFLSCISNRASDAGYDLHTISNVVDFSIFSIKVCVFSASVFRVATHYPYQNSTLDLFSRPFLKASNRHLHDKLHQSTILEFVQIFYLC